MEKFESEKLLNQYRKLLLKITWSYYHKTGIDQSELWSEAMISFCECLNKFEKKKGNITSWITVCVKNHLSNYVQKQIRRDKYSINLIEEIWQDQAPSNDLFSKFSTYPDPIIRAMAFVIEHNPVPVEDEKHGYKYGWLDKEVNKLGFSFRKIWSKYPLAKQIVRGEV